MNMTDKNKHRLISSLKTLATAMNTAIIDWELYYEKETINSKQLKGAKNMVLDWIEAVKKE